MNKFYALGLAALVVLPACGGGSSSSSSSDASAAPTAMATIGVSIAPVAAAPPVDVCSYVTGAEATAALGEASLPGKAHRSASDDSCRYYNAAHTKNVFVTVSSPTEVDAVGKGGKPVAGVGDRAVWYGGTLFVEKGSKAVSIGLYRSAASMTAIDPQIVPLAKAVAGRM